MLLGKVVGTLVASKKEPRMEGLRFLVVRQVGADGKQTGNYVVAVDGVGAGPEEMVLYATGSSARQTEATDNRPCDAIVMGIVDSWDLDGKEIYRK